MARRRGASSWWLLVPLALAAGAGALWWHDREPPAPPWRTVRIDRGAIVASVSATATVQPVTTVLVGSQLSGQVRELLADFNTPVKAGQVIARLDDDQIRARHAAAGAELGQARAGLATARAQADRLAADLALARSAVEVADAQEQRAQSQLDEALRDRERKRALAARGASTIAELDRSQSAVEQVDAARTAARAQGQGARAGVASAEAALAVSRTQIASAEALVAQREAVLRQVEVELDRAEIKAPIDGVVIRRDVDVGQTVAASLTAPVLFTIAQDLRHVEVHAAVDEADVGRIRPGQEAQFQVAAYPSANFRGEVLMTRLGAQTVQNVVTYTVVIAAENQDGRLLPGMTANVRLVTDRRDGVLRAPNAALRWRPAGAPRGQEAAQVQAPAPGGSGRGGGAGLDQLEATLARELSLDDAQRAALAGIVAEGREQFRALRAAGLPPEQMRARMGAARQQVDRRIGAILRPEQQAGWEAWRAQRAAAAAAPATGRVHVLGPDGQPRAIAVRLGVGDGSFTEVSGEGIEPGIELVVGGGPRPARPAAPRRPPAARASACEMAATGAPFMQAEGLARVYAMGDGAVRALDGVDATIAHGEFVAVMGPSGSGKSTFMNLLGLLDQPSAGRYRLDGEDVAGLDADARATLRNRKLGFVFQSFNLLARASAVENVALPLVYGGVGRRARRARAARILERLGLGERLDHAPHELSGGQQQRVAIARALVNEPGAILADEPTGALDSRTGLGIMALFQELNAQGITIVVVTHDPEVAAFASRVLLFRDGRLVEDRRQAPRDARAALAAAAAGAAP